MNNYNFNFTDLTFNETWDYYALTDCNDDLFDYDGCNLNFFGVSSNLTYTNLDVNSYNN